MMSVMFACADDEWDVCVCYGSVQCLLLFIVCVMFACFNIVCGFCLSSLYLSF